MVCEGNVESHVACVMHYDLRSEFVFDVPHFNHAILFGYAGLLRSEGRGTGTQ